MVCVDTAGMTSSPTSTTDRRSGRHMTGEGVHVMLASKQCTICMPSDAPTGRKQCITTPLCKTMPCMCAQALKHMNACTQAHLGACALDHTNGGHMCTQLNAPVRQSCCGCLWSVPGPLLPACQLQSEGPAAYQAQQAPCCCHCCWPHHQTGCSRCQHLHCERASSSKQKCVSLHAAPSRQFIICS